MANTESENFFRLVRFIVDVGSEVLRDVLLHAIEPDTLDGVLQTNRHTIDSLYYERQRVLFDNEYSILTETPTNPHKFDITLIVKIFRNICPMVCPNLIPPKYDWSPQSPPGPNDTSLADDIHRLRDIRNSIFAHITSTKVTNDEFQDLWAEIRAVISRTVGHGSSGLKLRIKDTIDYLISEDLSPSSCESLLTTIRFWRDQDERQHQNILIELKKHSSTLSDVETDVQGLHEEIDEIRTKVLQDSCAGHRPSDQDKEDLKQYLKGVYKKKLNVTLLPKWIELHVSDMFSPVILVDDKPLATFEDIFCRDQCLKEIINDSHKTPIFLLGNAGARKIDLLRASDRHVEPSTQHYITV